MQPALETNGCSGFSGFWGFKSCPSSLASWATSRVANSGTLCAGKGSMAGWRAARAGLHCALIEGKLEALAGGKEALLVDRVHCVGHIMMPNTSSYSVKYEGWRVLV